MTARQRAMVGRKNHYDEHVSLDFGRKKTDKEVDKVEFMRQKAIKAIKRKELELEKREVSKKKTMDRLLKKKDSKFTSKVTSVSTSKPVLAIPNITYKLTRDGPLISYPEGINYPLTKSNPVKKVQKILCSVCNTNLKKYNCSRTNKPLCSLKCYKSNLISV